MDGMDYSEMAAVNKEMADVTGEMFEEFMSLYLKWFEKYPQITMFNCVQLPLNATLYMISASKGKFSQVMPSLPEIFIKVLKPFERLKGAWGKISDEDFVGYYETFYKEQFEETEFDDQDKEIIQKWLNLINEN